MTVKLSCSYLLRRHVDVYLFSDDGGDTGGLAKSRSRREKREKVGRKSALEQLKKAKRGEKVKYEVRNLSVVHVCACMTVQGYFWTFFYRENRILRQT